MMLTLKTAQWLRVKYLYFTPPLPPFLPLVMNVAFAECAGNASDPAQCGKEKHHVEIVLS